MAGTQFTCPHCGSTLTFGAAIAHGTIVECMICMRTFAAQPTAEAPKAAPVAGISVAERVVPKAAPIAQAKAAPAAPPTAESSGVGGKIALAAAALSLFVLLAGGIGLAAWKLNTGGQQHPQDADKTVAAVVPNDKGVPVNKTDVPAPKKSASVPDDDDDDTRRLKARENKGLKRKTPGGADGGDDGPPGAFNVSKQFAPGLDQDHINRAIEKGVAYLKKTQNPNGTWMSSYPVGYASLGGLTLLECQLPVDDPAVQRAAQFVRGHMRTENQTYELALAILFLDRLGVARDRPLIQGMALRLLAGQSECGAWQYSCPVLSPIEMHQLFTFLHSNKQLVLLNPLENLGKADDLAVNHLHEPLKLDDPFLQFNNLLAGGPEAKLNGKPNAKKPFPANMKPLPAQWLPANLREIPVVQNQGRGRGQHVYRPLPGTTDNSNTQFALLGIWTARRYDVPVDQAVLVAAQRFVSTQNKDGGWSYVVFEKASTPAMTGVGLIGMAMGHGAAPDIIKLDPKNPKNSIVKPALDDPIIRAGLATFAKNIGDPNRDPKADQFPLQDHYFLWCVERVAMLYDLKTINGKDWYGWGAQNLVHNQHDDGAWPAANYHGICPPLNTCFALLFLKRSNLVPDLTSNLRLHSGIRNPGQ